MPPVAHYRAKRLQGQFAILMSGSLLGRAKVGVCPLTAAEEYNTPLQHGEVDGKGRLALFLGPFHPRSERHERWVQRPVSTAYIELADGLDRAPLITSSTSAFRIPNGLNGVNRPDGTDAFASASTTGRVVSPKAHFVVSSRQRRHHFA